ncbi:MAG: 30S ribosomal protein S12 methylthiotransferase RimO [Anaerolineaceae bacterium]|nr:30S ribosomal protein S12 methylthiotransferase RimO [Anaerolineaceae bacterium]
MKYYLVSLGCAKNTVDSESIARLLNSNGWQAATAPDQADLMLVNTCGFIQPAREESYEYLNELAAIKTENQLLVAAGCLTERVQTSIFEQVPQVDGIIGARKWMDIVPFINEIRRKKQLGPVFYPSDEIIGAEPNVLRASIQGTSAYLKIADGCRRKCAYCSIPLIKGTTVSRDVGTILDDAIELQKIGMKEIILIAQDLTDYGRDLGLKNGLETLLYKLVKEIPQVPWIRLLYTFPGQISDELIDLIAENQQILNYIDIPLQHAHPQILKKMNRPFDLDWIYSTFEKIRKRMPDVTIRTTFIAGFPGETQKEFNFLMDFVKEMQFDRVGVFPFWFEKGTPSEKYGDPLPAEIKNERAAQLMQIQEGISKRINEKWIGKTMDVLIEGTIDDTTVGRSYRDAPEIDGLVFVNGDVQIGEIVPVKITGAMIHDLIGNSI